MAANGITSPLYRDLIRPVPAWTLDPGVTAPARARHLVAAQLADWHLDHLADDALLIVSELVTNAIRLGEAVRLAVHAIVTTGAKMLRIEVTGAGTGPDTTTAPTLPHPDAEHGRGLPIVDALTDTWGCDHHTDHTLVWAQLPLPATTQTQLTTAA